MSLLVGHITASGFSRNTEPARLLRAVVWLLQNMALGVTQKPEPLHLSMYLEKFSASRARSVERLVQWSSYHIAFSYLKRERKKKKSHLEHSCLGVLWFLRTAARGKPLACAPQLEFWQWPVYVRKCKCEDCHFAEQIEEQEGIFANYSRDSWKGTS